MFKFQLEHMLHSIRNVTVSPRNTKTLFLENKQRVDKGLLLTLDLQLSYWPNDDVESVKTRAWMNVLLCGNTNVWVQQNKNYHALNTSNYESWVNTNNHDDCWTTEGIGRPLTVLFFDQADEINLQLKVLELPEVAPAAMRDFSFIHSMDIVTVIHTTDPTDKNKYRRNIVKITSAEEYEKELNEYNKRIKG